jgi:hypothetical protein
MKSQELLNIYNHVVSEFDKISQFNRLTSFTYDLALASVENNDGKNPALKAPDDAPKDIVSYSMADMEVKGVELVRGWITLEEYSKKTGLPLEEVRVQADNGELGDVREKNGEDVVFWPPEEQSRDDLPPVDSKNNYRVRMQIKGSVVYNQEAGLEEMISFLGPADKLEKKTSEAVLMLNRETFLLYWSTFEQYVKSITFALFELFPEQVFKNRKYGKSQMTYLDIFEGSSHFTDIQELKENIINSIIGDPGTERESISKQISFIKECYLEKSQDPYDTWYVLEGERKEVNYQVLDQIRMIRNALVHKTGEMTEDWEKIDLISRPDDDRIVVDDDLLLKTELILKSISCNLYRLISNS